MYTKLNGKAIYKPKGKAGEYSGWACNLYNGCTNECSYCYNNSGVMAGTLGGTDVRLKASLVDELTAYEIFGKELLKFKDQILAEGASLHYNFVSDPCLPQTIDLNWKCIDFSIANNVPVQVLTKRADWLEHPAVQDALANNGGLLKVGFSLTGVDAAEPHASPNAERIQAMKILHDMGITTWASCEPILNPEATYFMIEQTLEFCDHYKIGVLSGKKDYTPQQIRDLVDKVSALNPKSVYWKQSLIDYIKK